PVRRALRAPRVTRWALCASRRIRGGGPAEETLAERAFVGVETEAVEDAGVAHSQPTLDACERALDVRRRRILADAEPNGAPWIDRGPCVVARRFDLRAKAPAGLFG